MKPRLLWVVPCLVVVGVLVLAEILLRLVGFTVWHNPLDAGYDAHALVEFDPALGFRNRRDVFFASDKRPGQRQTDQLNLFGMRQPPLTHEKPPAARRIAVVGDSISFGVGMASYRDLYPHLVEQLCAASGTAVEALNFGTVGNTSFQVRWGLEYVLSFEPDALIVMIGNNDCRRHLGIAEALVPDVVDFDRRLDRWIPGSRRLVLANLVRRGVVQLRIWSLRGEHRRDSDHRVSPAEFRANLVSVAKTCREAGVRLYLVDEKLAVNPACPSEKTWGDRSKMENYPRYREILQDVSRAEGVGFIDVGVVLEAARKPPPIDYRPEENRVLSEYLHLFVAQDPIHLNATGHRLVTETIYDRLVQDGVCR